MTPAMIYQQADRAGNDAVAKLAVVPMIVKDTNSNKQWYVEDGVCGFASIIVKPATSVFARYLKANGLARKHYYGGLAIYISAFNQSLQKKEAYAYAFARVLNENGIRATVDSRMD